MRRFVRPVLKLWHLPHVLSPSLPLLAGMLVTREAMSRIQCPLCTLPDASMTYNTLADSHMVEEKVRACSISVEAQWNPAAPSTRVGIACGTART